MGFVIKYLIFAMITAISTFLPESWLSKHYRLMFALYMLIVGIIFII